MLDLAISVNTDSRRTTIIETNRGVKLKAPAWPQDCDFQLVAFAFFTKVFAIAEGLLPNDPKLTSVLKFFTLEKGIVASAGVFLVGILLLARAIWLWQQAHFGELQMEDNLRHVIPAGALVVLGIQGIFSSFFMSTLGLKTKTRKPPAA